MIRSILRHLTAPVLGLFAPEILTSIRRAELNAARAQGRADELRDLFDARRQALESAREDLGQALERATKAEREVETLRSEARSAAADDEVYTCVRQALDDVRKELKCKAGDESSAAWALMRDAELMYRIGWTAIVHTHEHLASIRMFNATDIDTARAEIRVGQLERERDELQRRLEVRGERANEDGALILALQSSEINAAREIVSLQRVNSELETQRDAHRSALVAMTAERDSALAHAAVTQEERDYARRHLDASHAAGKEAQEDIDAAWARIRGLESRGVVESKPEPAVNGCAWCLSDVGDCNMAINGLSVGERLRLCRTDAMNIYPGCDHVRARVAARAASCPSRRTSPDPLAIACPECLLLAGEECDGLGFKRSVARSMAADK